MGLRFRRSVKLFPGVRLNFSRSGISTTVGVRGAGLTFGPRGTYAHVGVPGSGLSYRTKVSPSAKPVRPNAIPVQPEFHPTAVPIGNNDEQQIHSAAVGAMTSTGLGELKRLINEAALRKITLAKTVDADEVALTKAKRRLAFARAFIIRLFTQHAIPRLASQADEADEKLADSTAQLNGCYVDIDFGLDDAASGTFAAMCRSFETLRTSQKIWDVTATASTDRVKERTTATQRVSRTPVRFDFSEMNIIRSKFQTMRLGNASGLELHLYPGFLLTREPSSDFALIEWRDADIQFVQSRFIEEEKVPSDTEVVDYTWAKANKDGSRDRRFNNNYQIPIARYADIWFRSPTGLLEAYMISNYASAQNFATAIAHHKEALERIDEHPQLAEPEEEQAETDDAQAPREENNAIASPSQPQHFYYDWAALTLLLVGIAYGSFWIGGHASDLRHFFQSRTQNQTAIASTDPSLPSDAAPSQRMFVFVQRRVVNIRSAPTTTATVVAKATAGEKFEVFDVKEKWTQVGNGKPTGWVYSSLIGTTPPR